MQGILIVTGTLTLHGAFSFRGMIVVTGRGGVERLGAGNGEIFGNLIVAQCACARPIGKARGRIPIQRQIAMERDAGLGI